MATDTLIIFGATGDLAHRKLLPALWKGFLHGKFNDLKIIGVARRPWDNEVFRKTAEEASHPQDLLKWKLFAQKLSYQTADVTEHASFDRLCDRLCEKENLLFFLATSPEFFEPISQRLASVQNKGFKRLMIEKPFGHDLNSARSLHTAVQKAFGDEVYAVDHYLGKSVVRNLLALRFSNRIFEGVWNRRFIERIQIMHSEEIGVGRRAAYYDSTGAFKDMVQSHLLQILARIAMEKPREWTQEEVMKEKVKVLKALKPTSQVVFGQYQGYAAEVGHSTSTETFAALKLYIDNPRFRGVPIFLSTGKKLSESFARISVTFKPVDFMGATPATTLMVELQPDERFALTVNLRRPGQSVVEPFKLEYCTSCDFNPYAPEAYEALFEDALNGKKSFFVWWPEIEASWRFVEAVLKKASQNVFSYTPGTRGPTAAQPLLNFNTTNNVLSLPNLKT